MNERIKELSDQCYEKHELLGTYEFNKDKFAKLIIEEYTHPLHKEINRLNSLVDELEEDLQEAEMRLWDIKD